MAPPIRLLNPSSLQDPPSALYSHVAVTDPGSRLVYLAGQVGIDRNGTAAPTLAEQARLAYSNVKTCLAEIGASAQNVVSLTIYIVDYDAAPEHSAPIWEAHHAFLTDDQGNTHCPAGTLVPVPALASPEYKIEVQCVAALPSAPCPSPKRPTQSSITDVDVVVVGAGLSGLQAATDVQNAGLSCVVLEAKDCVGGKTQSVRINSRGMVDVGAAWINDTTQTKMYELFKKFGCEPLVQRTEGHDLFRGVARSAITERLAFSGFPTSDPDQEAIFGKIYEALDIDAAKIDIYDTTKNTHLEDISLGEYFRRLGAQGLSWDMWTVYVRALTGCEPDFISLAYFLDYVKSGGGMESLLTDKEKGAQYLRNRKGNQTISVRLAADLQPNTVYLNTPVTKITQTPTGSIVETMTASDSASPPTTFRCRKVLVSIPTPLYRHIQFTPALPAEKQAIVNATHLGAYSKCILAYTDPWWRRANLSGGFCKVSGPISFSRDVSSDADGVFALACFMFGDYAISWSRLAASQRVRAVQDQLAQMLDEAGHPELRAKVMDTAQTVEKQWLSEAWCEGAPCPMVAPGGIWGRYGNQLRVPVGNVHFIGTETAFEWKGYMEGAVRAGERGAREVVDALRFGSMSTPMSAGGAKL